MYTATCLCGACHIKIDKIIGTGLCYCNTCRKMTSSAFTMNSAISNSDFHLVSGEPKQRQHVGDTGAETTMNFCGDCGSMLWMNYSPMPGLKILKSGLLDGIDVLNSKDVQPQAEQYTDRRPVWLCAIQGAVQHPGQQQRKDYDAILDETQAQKEGV